MFKYIAFIVTVIFTHVALSDGYLFVSPQRVNLSDRNKVTQLHLVNKSEQTKTYKITLVDYVMGSDGTLNTDEELEFSAKDKVRYSPRRVTLGPQKDQYIRVMARPKKDVADGGYHTHIQFDEVETASEDDADASGDINEGKASFTVGASYGVAIPVNYVKGKVDPATVDLISGEVELDEDKTAGKIKVSMTREGLLNSNHMLLIDYVKDGATYSVSTPTRLSIYREANELTRTFKLKAPTDQIFEGGEIMVRLLGPDAKSNEQQEFDVLKISVN